MNNTMLIQPNISAAYAEPQQFTIPQAAPDGMTLSVFQENLANSLRIVNDEVMKGYISELSELQIVAPDTEQLKALDKMQFFRIKEIVYEKDEFSVHKLSTVFHTLSSKACTLALMIHSDGVTNDFYLGVRSLDKKAATGTMRSMLEQSFTGLFPGSRFERYSQKDLEDRISILRDTCHSVTGVTCIADYKKNEADLDNASFIQGLEKFIQSMSGKKFTTVIIANNLDKETLTSMRREYESIYSMLSPFADMQINFSQSTSDTSGTSNSRGTTENTNYSINKSSNESDSTSVGVTDGTSQSHSKTDTISESDSVSNGTTDSVSHTKGISNTTSVSGTVGTHVGVSAAGASVGKSYSATVGNSTTVSASHTTSHAVTKTLTHTTGKSHSDTITKGTNHSVTNTKGKTTGTSEGYSYAVGNALSIVDGENYSNTLGTSQGITLNSQNMTLKSIMKKLERQLERVEECESIGMWDCAAYFLGDIPATTETAANVYYSVMSGNQSGVETSGIHILGESFDNIKAERTEWIKDYILNFVHPKFSYNGFDYDSDRTVIVDPSATISTNELAIHMGLPRHSVKGLPVVEHSTFAQEIVSINREQKFSNDLMLGHIYHLGEKTETPLQLDMNSLSMHTFVTGSTGSGKSNAVYQILKELRNKGIPFLVVEPAKGEYGNVFVNANYFGTNPKLGRMLKINPFAFPENIHVLEHIDRLTEIFNVCWPMYAAMPAVLKSAIEQAYISAGWDIDTSENHISSKMFPTFDDVVNALTVQIENSAYSSDSKGDYIGSLTTRLKSLTNGINGRIFAGSEQNLHELFDEDAVLDISRIGSSETKALIMGLVILKLQEYRMSNAESMNVPLKHVTVLEEAHNILKKTSTQQSQDSSNVQGKAVEMLTNTIAEIRTYGEGFIIADQAPSMLDTAAIRNTNTKLVFKLPEENDREAAGRSIGLTDEQISELAKLPTGVAAVYQNNWREAILCNLQFYKVTDKKAVHEPSSDGIQRTNNCNNVLHKLISFYEYKEIPDKLTEEIVALDIPARIRRELIISLSTRGNRFENAMADFVDSCYNINNTFAGTDKGVCETIEQVKEIAISNVGMEFQGFDKYELPDIFHFICLARYHETKNPLIGQLYKDSLRR